MKTILTPALIAMLASLTANDALTGRWETQVSVNGNVTGVVFKQGGSFEGYINKKPFTSGNYKLQDSIFSFTDNGCNGIKGVYKAVFFSNADSLRFEVMEDSCDERREGMSRLVLGK